MRSHHRMESGPIAPSVFPNRGKGVFCKPDTHESGVWVRKWFVSTKERRQGALGAFMLTVRNSGSGYGKQCR